MVIEPGQEMRIGVSASLSGDTALVGEDIRDAVILAVEDFGGQILGFPIAVVAEDDGCTDTERAVAAASELGADPSVVAVIGPMCSDGAQVANLMYERTGLIHISASASMPSLTEQRSQVFFRTAWRDDRQGAALADYAAEALGARTAVAIDGGDLYGADLAAEFALLLKVRGGATVRETIAAGQTDFRGLLDRITAESPDAVLFAGFPSEAVPFAEELREAEYEGSLLAPDSLFEPVDFVAAAGPAAEGALILGPPRIPDMAAADFERRFGREARTPFVGHAYDAAMALLIAVNAVASEENGQLTIDRVELLKALRARVFTGLTGRIDFDSNGDRAGVTPEQIGLTLYVVRDGEFVPVAEAEATSETPMPSPTVTMTPAP